MMPTLISLIPTGNAGNKVAMVVWVRPTAATVATPDRIPATAPSRAIHLLRARLNASAEELGDEAVAQQKKGHDGLPALQRKIDRDERDNRDQKLGGGHDSCVARGAVDRAVEIVGEQ